VSERLCPCCFRPYAFRVPRRVGPRMKHKVYYRCGTAGRWLYLHTIPLHGETPPEVTA